MATRFAARVLAAPEEWDRRKLQAAGALAGLVLLALVVGVVWTMIELLGSGRQAADVPPRTAGHPAVPEVPAATLDEAWPGPLTTTAGGVLRVPQPGTLGAAQVGTGLPRTPEGAMAQLIAIDQRAIQSGSVVTAQGVISAWAAPGGPTPESWTGVEAVSVLLDAAGLPANGATDLVVELRPAMGVIRDRTDEAVTPCVDFVLTTTMPNTQPVRVAVADCQRMVWLDGRWVIGAGPEPKPSPSLWPGSQASYDAGYLWLEVEP
jgi:hypothetical protein